MRGFAAIQLDLSKVAVPDAVRGVSYETIRSDRLARLKELLRAAGIDWDVEGLESDPGVIIEEADSYREMYGAAWINNAVRAVMLAHAQGSDLDNIAANFLIKRAPGEEDDRLRLRIQLAPDAYGSAGSEGAYVFWTFDADDRIFDAAALGYGSPGLKPGEVRVIFAAPAEAESDALAKVTRKLFSREIKPLTDILTVRAASKHLFRISAILEIPRGPDPLLIEANARNAIADYLKSRRKIGALIANSGIAGALHVGGVERVQLLSPNGDVTPDADAIAVCSAVDITVRILR